MSNYARPRVSIVIDNDVMEAAKRFADEEQRPVATYLSLLVSDVIRNKLAASEHEKKPGLAPNLS
ncbi:MAG: hypothetical protein HC907_14950 [Richelia sp. SM1_7_0]|nr:hypothetical protein [Richelia sp. SM1_7_0]